MSLRSGLALSLLLLLAGRASAQHLWWDTQKLKDATCLYGEITVLATNPGIYYCGANWHPGEPAGGYCGIQHNSAKERRTIFSIWDTSPTLHPKTTEADPKTLHNRFGGEGEGGHTHMIWDWQLGETFQFYVEKKPAAETGMTDARYYIFDRKANKWRHSATITCPNGDAKSEASVKTIGGGGLCSFLENFTGKGREAPKLALYRLWLGSGPDDLKCLTKAGGDGIWGRVDDAYFLAEGDGKALGSAYAKLKEKHGAPTVAEKGKKVGAILEKPLTEELRQQLKSLPRAGKAKEK